MTNVLANIARMASATTGTGTLTLGAAVQSCLTFAQAGITNGQVVSYAIEDYDSGGTCIAREVGQGTYTSVGPTLARSAVYASTNAGAEIDCSGLQHVFITAAAEDFATLLTASAADALFLTPAEGNAAYQPLDADLTAIAAVTTTAYGRALLALADAAALGALVDPLFLTPAEGNAAYQPLDADLTAVAALTTAAYGRSLLETTSEANFKAAVNLEAADILAALLTVDGAASGLDADLLDGQSSAFYATATGLSDHLADTADAHDASAISFAPAGGIAATDVQAAIVELDTEKQSADATLTALAAYNTNGILAQTAADTFAGRTLTGTANQVVISNGDGVAGNPTFSLPQSIATGSTVQFAAIELNHASGNTLTASGGHMTIEGATVWDSGNDGSGSGLDADTVDGKNVSTSGNAIPLMDGTNTWSGPQTFNGANIYDNLAQIFSYSDDGALSGPNFTFRRSSTTPAVSDVLAAFAWQGNDSGGNIVTYQQIDCVIIDPTDGSEDARYRFLTTAAGTLANRMIVQAGIFTPAATGADKGTNTINASAIYDDSVLLCAPIEFIKTGVVNTSTWDAFAIDIVEPEDVVEEDEFVDIVLPEPETKVIRERNGTFRKVVVTTKKVQALDEHPVLDAKGEQVGTVKAPRRVAKVIPEKRTVRQNELAHEFKAMLDEGFDPRVPAQYFDKMLADEALPGLKTKTNWVPNAESNAKRTNRIVLALEMAVATMKTMHEEIEALKKKVK